MIKIYIFLLLSVSITLSTFSQNYLFVIDKQYPATPNWSFQLGRDDIGPRLDLKFGKNGNNGFLAVSTSTRTHLRPDSEIKGSLYLFLEEGKTIKLKKELFSDSYDDEIISIYSLDSSDVFSLAQLNIVEIRFSIEERDILGNKSAKNYTAVNKRPSSDFIGKYLDRVYVNENDQQRKERQKSQKKILEYFETSSDIRHLIKD
tara:strand:+ start:24541 stop:25149 length:609 start_codon:yes stop_codon:yes gene_type:complete